MFLLKSKITKKLLKFYFANENRRVYLNELARILKVDPKNLDKKIKELEKDGLFTSEFSGKQKYYFLNKRYPLYKELKTIVFKTIGIENNIRNIVSDIKKINYAYIFGSYDGPGFRGDSDIDLCIIGNDINEDFLAAKIDKLEKNIGRDINYHIYTLEDYKKKLSSSSFLQNIHKNNLFLTNNYDEFRKIFG